MNTYDQNNIRELPVRNHFYGYDIRKHFLIGAVLLMLVILLDRALLDFNMVVGVVGMLVIITLAGLTTPRNHTVAMLDAVVSGLMFVFFEYLAIAAYLEAETFFSLIFVIRQAVALVFASAFYLSIKTIRSFLT